MKMNIVAVVSALLLGACGGESDDLREDATKSLGRVDSCDLRNVTGTCVEYTMSELEDWYRENVERTCSINRRGDLVGTYRKDFRCPAEKRVARCEGMIEDPAEQYEYDKHYYADIADGYSWKPENVQVTCEHVSGHFVPE